MEAPSQSSENLESQRRRKSAFLYHRFLWIAVTIVLLAVFWKWSAVEAGEAAIILLLFGIGVYLVNLVRSAASETAESASLPSRSMRDKALKIVLPAAAYSALWVVMQRLIFNEPWLSAVGVGVPWGAFMAWMNIDSAKHRKG